MLDHILNLGNQAFTDKELSHPSVQAIAKIKTQAQEGASGCHALPLCFSKRRPNAIRPAKASWALPFDDAQSVRWESSKYRETRIENKRWPKASCSPAIAVEACDREGQTKEH